jgi:FAD/FMN-containing dehydrogenase
MSQANIEQLRSRFRGEILLPGDDAYESARKVYNAMIDRRPAAIARCVDVADVMAAVEYGRENHLLTAIRGGGHNGGGLGICDNGLVIDLSRMRSVRVDPAARTVRAEGGCVWGDVDHATHAFAQRYCIDDGCRRADPWRRNRPLNARIRSDD